MNCVQISKEAQRNWSTARGQTSIPSELRANRQLICGLCRVWQEGNREKRGKKSNRHNQHPTQSGKK